MAVLSGDDTIMGTVHFTQNACSQPVLVEVNVTGLNVTIGHGFHIHETGDLSNGCISLAAHYNPHEVKLAQKYKVICLAIINHILKQRDHGGPADEERHVGDLGNIIGDANGLSNKTFSDDLISLAGPRNIIGRGVIVHLNVDDLGRGNHTDSLTTGNAGPRVACGVIGYM